MIIGDIMFLLLMLDFFGSQKKQLPSNQAEVISATDYYPFGMTLPGRSYSMQADGDRLAFTGQDSGTVVLTYMPYLTEIHPDLPCHALDDTISLP